MARRTLNEVVRYLQHLTDLQNGSGLSDAELLERYVRQRDEAAFELLLWRHGVLVLNVCRRILHREADAEDAFQATFLAFVRKAPSIERRGSVASWLYKVAYRVALEARARARKTAARERAGGESLAIEMEANPLWDELRPILDEELNRLPERLRRPFVLCYLEGKTNDEAARELGCPAGTIYSRLARGRELLRRRLLRRGVTLSAVALTAALAENTIQALPTAPLVTMTRRAATLFAAGHAAAGRVPPQVTALAEGVLRTMFLSKVRMTALLLLVAGLLTAGGVWTQHALKAAAEPEARKVEEAKKPVRVVRPSPGGLERIAQLPGHVRAAAQQQVSAAVSGYLKRLLVDTGDLVKKGQLLAEIDAPLLVKDAEQAAASYELAKGQLQEAKAHVATAEAESRFAASRIKAGEAKLRSDRAYLAHREKQTERYKQLLAERSIDARLVNEQEDRREAALEAVNASQEALTTARASVLVSQSKIESAKAAVASAEASLRIAQAVMDKARVQVDFTQLRANFDGVVTRRNFDVGDYIAANDRTERRPLLIVQRTDTVRVVTAVAANDVSLTRPGVPALVSTAALPEEHLPACKVSRIGFALDENSNSMPIEIDMPNPRDLLRPGMTVAVVLQLYKPAANAFTVPGSCIVGDDRKGNRPAWVYIVRDGKAHRTRVQLGRVEGPKFEILQGVRSRDEIVEDPQGLEGDVVPVEIKKAP